MPTYCCGWQASNGENFMVRTGKMNFRNGRGQNYTKRKYTACSKAVAWRNTTRIINPEHQEPAFLEGRE